MARKPRIEYDGALYHVITRGNQKQKVFKEPSDFKKYLGILASYKQRYHFRLYAYVLMGNHVHLLIETKDVPLSKVLQGINQSYTLYFNRTYKTSGHLFQGRYKAILCDQERYLLALLKYIHYNPLRARIVETPGKYAWSSYRAYLAKTAGPDLIDTEQVLRMFSENRSRARRQYEAFMNDGAAVKKEDIYATVDQRLLGDEQFVGKITEKYEGTVRRERRKKQYSLPRIAAAIEKRNTITVDEMRSWSRMAPVLSGRVLFSLMAKEYGYSGREIAAYLKKDPAAVTGYLRKGNEHRKETDAIIDLLTKERP